MKFDELKVDSGGAFNNMTAWEQVLNATGRQIALENCHQGGELQLGGHDPSSVLPGSHVTWLPLVEPEFSVGYRVRVSSLRIGNTALVAVGLHVCVRPWGGLP